MKSAILKNILNNKRFFLFLFLCLMILVGFLNGAHHIMKFKLLANEGGVYYPYTITAYDIVNTVGGRIKEVLDGRFMIPDLDIYEYKDSPAFMSPLGPLFFLPFRFFTDSVSSVLVISDFLFPAIFFLLFFFLYYYISKKRKWLSLFFATFTCLFFSFSIYIPPPGISYLKKLIDTTNPFTNSPIAHFLTRREAFIPGLIPFLLSLIFTYLALRKNKKLFAILGGVFLAINAYIYPYHFIYLSVSMGLLFVILLFKKNKALLKQLIILFLSTFIFLIPFFILQIELRSLPQYYDLFQRFGVETGRGFRWWHWQRYLFLILLSFLVWAWGKKTKNRITSYFIISFLLSAILCLNMQMFLGFSVQTDHWLNRDFWLGMSLAYFILILYIVDYLKKENRFWKFGLPIIAVVLLVFLSINSVRRSVIVSEKEYLVRVMPSNIIESYQWLNDNTLLDSVIMTPSLVNNYYIPFYTHNRIFLPRALTSIAPEEEAIERLFIVYKIFNIDKEYLDSIINPNRNAVQIDNAKQAVEIYEKKGVLYLFCDKYSSQELDSYTAPSSTPSNDKPIPLKLYKKIVNDYGEFVCDNCLSKHKVDFIYYGPQEKKITKIDFSQNDSLQKVYDHEEIEIYKFIK